MNGKGSHGARSSSTVIPYTSAHPLLREFENRLSSHMEKLWQPDRRHSCRCLNARWLRRAVDAFLSTHSQAEEVLFPRTVCQSRATRECVNRQLEDTLSLLDMCNAVRESVCEMKQLAGPLQLAMHCLAPIPYNFLAAGQLVRARNALAACVEAMAKAGSKRKVKRSKLEKCSSLLRRIGEFKPAGGSAAKGNDGVVEEIMKGWKGIAALVCGALVAALCTGSERPTWSVSGAGRMMTCSSLLTVQRRVKEEEAECRRRGKGDRALLQEFDSLDAAVRNLYGLVNGFVASKALPLGKDRVVQLMQSVQAVEKCRVELEEGLRMLEKPVDQMFKALICSRMALLDILSYS